MIIQASKKASAVKNETPAEYKVEKPKAKRVTKNKVEKENEIIEQALQILAERIKRSHVMSSPDATRNYLKISNAKYESEIFRALFLDNQHGLIADEVLFYGSISQCGVYPREVVKRALELNAAAVIFSHNHPSGVAEPSGADRQITDRLVKALDLIDVRVLDHIVTGGSDSVSFAERGWV